MVQKARRVWRAFSFDLGHLSLGKPGRLRPIPAQGSPLRFESRFDRFLTVYWLAARNELSSDQASGTATGAPARARVE